ncbi:hypothetical protein [Tractidigestivibacter sp.]|uniref:hypothetical protein n=1 Tax=Tractidigestivibacter sp. TaxID=2847320 RepID=UPI002A8070CA|nr:hypothetical protein [Tractidigestivibacter sp.]MDY4535627.1 hypothetical protein [Tractidigestivibacter sp.]MDY5272325.1 hypothetical protein [Tractidigestivibacter sp.]
MARFYGIECRYGRDVVDSDGRRRGDVHVFRTKAERNAWIDADEWDGDYHRDTLTSKEARHLMESSLYFNDGLLEDKYHLLPSEKRYATMQQITECFLSGMRQRDE